MPPEYRVPTKSLIGISWSANLSQAATLMIERDIGALGIYSTDGAELIGILTERDITMAMAKNQNPITTKVREVMTDSPIEIEGPITHRMARDLMRQGHVRHLIVHENGADRIVSIRDV